MKTKYLFFSVLFVFIVWGIVACKDDDGLDEASGERHAEYAC